MMKIADVHLTLFGWDDIPATRYGIHTGTFSGASQLGLLTIETDDGVKGHAFLGSAMRGAHLDGQSLIQFLKPIVLGQDPLEDDDLLSYVKLKQHLAIPILATEYAPGGLTAYAPWLVHQATDYLRGDVAAKGGITALVKAAHLAQAFHMNYEIHHGGNSLNNVANLHVIMAIRNTEMFEVLLPAAAQKYGLAQDIEVDKQGLVHAPNGPGLGAAIDFDLIERNKTAVLA